MECDANPPGDYPRLLRIIDTTEAGFVVDADGARTYLDPALAWRLAARLLRPELNTEPMGNC